MCSGALLTHGLQALRTQAGTAHSSHCSCSSQLSFQSIQHTTGSRTKCLEQQEPTYNEHGHQQVLLGDLGVGEDVVQHRVHVALVLLPQSEDTLVIVPCGHKGTAAQAPHLSATEYKVPDVSLLSCIDVLRIYFAQPSSGKEASLPPPPLHILLVLKHTQHQPPPV